MENRIFAGAKRYEVLKEYEKNLGIPKFEDAIDWGMLFFLTKPFFYALEWLSGIVGSFGWAILAFTVLVKLPLVPLYNQSYKSMAKMKKLQEPTQEIRERFKADPQRQQQEIMKLYKEEGANPLGGCLPILVRSRSSSPCSRRSMPRSRCATPPSCS
jgi:YidC/Oxa1 family membrane protein insertase